MQASQTSGIRPPSVLLTLTELHRASLELASLPLAAPLLALAPRGDGSPVLVLPGFITSDRSTRLLRGYLERQGYDAQAWKLGRNLGPKAIGWEGEKLLERLSMIFETSGRKVSLVGWSLGGIMARELARAAPDMVERVISLGSPFTGDPQATTPAKLYEHLTGDALAGEALARRLRESVEPLPVPTTSIYSREDGVVPWRNCIEPPHARAENIEVHGSHCGMGVNPAVLYVVADRLATPVDAWRPFRRESWLGGVYPSSPSIN